MRVVYFGSGAFGLPTLRALVGAHDVVAVVTQPDKPAGRGGKLAPTPIGAWVAEQAPHIELIEPEKVNAPEFVAKIRGFGAEAWVVIAYGQKLSKGLLEGVFAVNLHASLLPRWRGAAPINAAILSGDVETGNSVITLADRMDAGLVLGQSRRTIGALTTAGELHDELSEDGPALVERVLSEQLAGATKPVVQDESQVTIATKLSKDDGVVDFEQRADFLRRQVHALTPWPGVAVVFQAAGMGLQAAGTLAQVKLLRVEALTMTDGAAPGTLINAAQGLIACGHSTVLKVLEVQPAGKRSMPWEAFVRGAGRTLAPGTLVWSAREAA